MIDVVLLPAYLDASVLERSQVVVLDILRASSTIVTALGNGAREVRLFGDIASTLVAKVDAPSPIILGGERECLRIDGFDCGNSPAEYSEEKVRGATVLLTTTNGTVAAVAAQAAQQIFIGSLLNATDTAKALLPQLSDLDTVLLCAGTQGKIAFEDVIGAGAILWQIMQMVRSPAVPFSDTAWMAYHTFASVRQHLPAALRLGQGGLNLINAELEEDIDRCARVDSQRLVATVKHNPLRVVCE